MLMEVIKRLTNSFVRKIDVIKEKLSLPICMKKSKARFNMNFHVIRRQYTHVV